MGGTNNDENLIDLFAREHFEAHRLLALEHPEHDGVIYAWWNMAHITKFNQRDYEVSANEYEEAKIAFSKTMREAMKGRHFTDETLQRMKESAQERLKVPENNPMYGKRHSEETKNKISKSKVNLSEKTRKKMSDAKPKRAVICLTTGIVYESVREAERQTGVYSGRYLQVLFRSKET